VQPAIREATALAGPFEALGRWLARPGAAQVLVFIALYRLADFAMGPMVVKFWTDRGIEREEFALVSTFAGSAATIAGAFLGGRFVTSTGIPRALFLAGLLALLSNLGYAAAAAWPGSGRAGVYGASVVESFCSGLAVAAFLAFLMRICEREHAAVEYASLSALYALVGRGAGAGSGYAVEWLGYPGFFAATAALGLPAFAWLGAARRFVGAVPREEGGEGT
jgi:PAT family beta-lactamase induction signal transducer AmpG